MTWAPIAQIAWIVLVVAFVGYLVADYARHYIGHRGRR